jgi:hypothetical protein
MKKMAQHGNPKHQHGDSVHAAHNRNMCFESPRPPRPHFNGAQFYESCVVPNKFRASKLALIKQGT